MFCEALLPSADCLLVLQMSRRSGELETMKVLLVFCGIVFLPSVGEIDWSEAVP